LAGGLVSVPLARCARSRPLATAAFRRVFERFNGETTARQWADAFATQRDAIGKAERGQGK